MNKFRWLPRVLKKNQAVQQIFNETVITVRDQYVSNSEHEKTDESKPPTKPNGGANDIYLKEKTAFDEFINKVSLITGKRGE